MITPVEVVVSLSAVFGLVCWWLGLRSAAHDAPGAEAFGWFLFGWGGIPELIFTSQLLVDLDAPVGSIAGLLWCAGTIPWVVFALRYSGTSFGRRTMVAATVPLVGILPLTVAGFLGRESAAAQTLGVFTFVYYTAIAVVGAVVIVQASARYSHIPLKRGLVVALAGVIPPVTMNAFGILAGSVPDLLINTLYAAGVAGTAGTAAIALVRYDMFDATPAPGVIGDRTLGEVTDNLVFVTDRTGRLVSVNPAAEAAVGASIADSATHSPSPGAGDAPEPTARRDGGVGRQLSAAIGVGLETLREADTVEVRTTDGKRTFDPSVTPLADQYDEPVGHLVSLHDVTDREIRRQRLEVLNRIMRHNVRNRTTVVTGNAEWVARQVDDDQLADRLSSATDAAESLAALSQKTKRIESILSREGQTTAFQLGDVVGRAVPTGIEQRVSLEADDEPVRGDEQLVRFAVEMLTGAAAERDDGQLTVSATLERGMYPVRIDVQTDGEGVSSEEIAVLRAGTEQPLEHARGIDLWVTDWAVTDCGGELSFHDDGRLVRAEFPFEPAGDSQSTAGDSEPATGDSESAAGGNKSAVDDNHSAAGDS